MDTERIHDTPPAQKTGGQGYLNAPSEMPLGLGFQMAMNTDAMEHFSAMDESGRQRVIEDARGVQSKAEMEHLVQNLAKGER